MLLKSQYVDMPPSVGRPRKVLLSDCLTVHAPVMHIATCSVIVALLQLQVKSVKSQGEAAIAPVRQSRWRVVSTLSSL
jgi:hypothetical protein